MKFRHFFTLTAALALSAASQAELVFKDDSGREVRLKAPAKRIVTLAQHAAESLYAAGGGATLQAGNDLSDQASLQRGAQLYMNYCSSCHSLKFLRYSRMAEDLGLTVNGVAP